MKARFENKLVFWFTGLNSQKKEILNTLRKRQHVMLRATIETRYLQGGSKLIIKTLKDENIPLAWDSEFYEDWTARRWNLWERAEDDEYTIGAKARIELAIGSSGWIPITILRTKYWLESDEWQEIKGSLPIAEKCYGERTRNQIGKRLLDLAEAWRGLADDRGEQGEDSESKIYGRRARLLRVAAGIWEGED